MWCSHVGNHLQEDLARLLLKALGLANPVQKPSFSAIFFQQKFKKSIMLLMTSGLGGGSVMICSCSLSSSPSLEDSSFARTWVFPSCTFFFPFVGCFVFLMIGRFSSFCNGHSSQKKSYFDECFQKKNQLFKFIVLYLVGKFSESSPFHYGLRQ